MKKLTILFLAIGLIAMAATTLSLTSANNGKKIEAQHKKYKACIKACKKSISHVIPKEGAVRIKHKPKRTPVSGKTADECTLVTCIFYIASNRIPEKICVRPKIAHRRFEYKTGRYRREGRIIGKNAPEKTTTQWIYQRVVGGIVRRMC